VRIAAAALVALSIALPAGAQDGESSCIACHRLLGDEQTAIIDDFEAGAHREAELGCHGCHGGNPDPVLADDMEEAMDPGYEPSPFVGVPLPADVPSFCGRCHSDPTYMRRFEPDPRVDQEREYWTSHHGEVLRQGNTRVATCISCHGTHGILGPKRTSAPVYATNVAETCRRCHGDPESMQGSGLPVDQYARWRQSVHAEGLLEDGDLTAPTCNDCHGNHGATPPGVESIAFICGQCHGREASLFRNSSKEPGFANHRELMADADGCTDCHSTSQPQGRLDRHVSFSECATCHGNHGVVRPTVAMLSPLPDVPCAFCHQGGLETEPTERGREIRRHYVQVRDRLLEDARQRDLAEMARFDWMVERITELPYHRVGSSDGEDGGQLREQFERLFIKFRLGTSTYSYRHPATGENVTARVLRCGDCHGEDAELASEPVGRRTARVFVERMQELTSRTARAERLLLAAERGGVATRGVEAHIDQAIDAQIQLEVLVHTFDASQDGQFMQRFDEGMEAATQAVEAAQGALEEISYRRTGLFVSLALIVLVLAGLALKIRQISG